MLGKGSDAMRLRRSRRPDNCDHLDRVTTTNFGLRRTTCLVCGEVAMDRLEDARRGALFSVPQGTSGAG